MNVMEAIKKVKKDRRIERKLANGMTEVKEFHSNGNLWRHYFEDENGDYHGEYKCWRHDGTIWGYSNWKNGKRHGERKWWWSDGTIRIYQLWEDDKLVKDYLKEE